jgi:tetratricopeptide (TPR) repeat protein
MSGRLARLCSAVLAILWLSICGPPLCSQTSPAAKDAPSEEVSLQVIVVRTPEEAQEVIEELKKGANFTNLAREKSIDPTAQDGGFMGKFTPSSLRAELRDAVQGLDPGQFTAPVHIPSGYAVLRIMGEEGDAAAKSADPARSFALAATGTIKYTPELDGLSEAEAALLHFPKTPAWNKDPHTVCEFREKSLEQMISAAKELLAHDPGNFSGPRPIDAMQAHFALAELYSYKGEMAAALEEFQNSYRIATSEVPAAIPQMEEALGIAYLHKSEMENGAYTAPGERCLFPPRAANAYQDTHDSQSAIEYFLKYLEKKPNELEVLWLLNLAYLTVGKYPSGVPEKYLIPVSAFASKENVGRFADVAAETGLRLFSMAGGVVVDDFENNGLLDVVTSSFDSCGSMHYFHNNGDGTFTDQTAKSGLSGQVGGLNIMQTDYNNDGCLDLLVLRGGWEWPQRKSLLRNNCDGTFTDVTVAAGLGEPTSTQAAVWADINNDGWLDLFVGNESGTAQLFLNKGDGTFTDITYKAGVSGDGMAFSKGVAAADYDNDGYVDLYVSNLNGDNFLYHNNHDGTFTEVAREAGVPGSRKGFATWFFDYDNDGFPDLFVTSYFTSVDETIRTYLGLPHNATGLKLYKNLGNGTFRDATTEVGLDKVFMPMGANFGDVDNDGYLDIYLGTGNPSYASVIPNVLLRNHDGRYFVDITASSGTGELHKGHGIAFADLGNNGNEDIVAEVGGATRGDSHALRLFENPGHDNDWITLKLVGVKTNRPAIGARIKVTVENQGQGVRSIYRTVGSGGSFGASPLQQHIGLGKSARIVNIDVYWPVSNTHQVFQNVEKNQFLEIKELAESYTKLDRKPFRLKGPPAEPSSTSRNAAPNLPASKGQE